MISRAYFLLLGRIKNKDVKKASFTSGYMTLAVGGGLTPSSADFEPKTERRS